MFSLKPPASSGQSDDVNYTASDGDFDESDWVITPLSDDHKPDLPIEYKRITKKFNGRVLSYIDTDGNPVGPARVWLKNQNIPGLAMSRSIGDTVAHSVGVECSPEIKEFSLKKQDKILVIASDGLWEFLSNKEVLDIILPFYKKDKKRPGKAIDKLILKSTNKWVKEEG
jgi:serine/threonine protein phosphatase PrpC